MTFSKWQTLSHIVVVYLAENGIRTHNISGDGSCKSNYHTATTPLALGQLASIDNNLMNDNHKGLWFHYSEQGIEYL